MTDRARNLIVSITAISGLVVIVFLLLLFGSAPIWFESGYNVHVRLANASGLTPDSRVKLSGIDVGHVIEVKLEDPPRRGTVITALIREDVLLPRGARVHAQSPLLGGSPTLAFDISRLPDDAPLSTLPTDGSAMIHGEALTMVSQFAGELQAAISEPTRVLTRAADDFARLTDQWVKVGESVDGLMEQRSTSQVDQGAAAANLATVLARLDQRLAELEAVTTGLQAWVGDESLKQDVDNVVAGALELTEKLTETADDARQTIAAAEENLDRLTKRYIAVADDLSGVVLALHEATNRANNGDGTIARLLNDPELYDNLADAGHRLGQMLKEARLLIQKWKAEGLPVQF